MLLTGLDSICHQAVAEREEKMEKQVQLKTATLNGKSIGYNSETEFLVQVGRYQKGSYRTRYRFVGDLGQAVRYFNCINIGYGYKKRLVSWSMNKPVLARVAS